MNSLLQVTVTPFPHKWRVVLERKRHLLCKYTLMMVIHPKFRSLLKKSKRITNRIEDQKDPKEVQLIFFKFLTIL
jgi:hypothetical protein